MSIDTFPAVIVFTITIVSGTVWEDEHGAGLFYREVSEIPDDHYKEIINHTSKPIAFTEIGWHSAPSPIGWESSQEEQAEFISKFFELTKELDVEITIWSFMYDLDIFEPFNTMGLINADGEEKSAWEEWVK